MEDVKFSLNTGGTSFFTLAEAGKQVGFMEVELSGNNLLVYHTEVLPEHAGKGFARQLLNAMVNYASENKLMVIPLCPYVNLQFRRNEAVYNAIWNRSADHQA